MAVNLSPGQAPIWTIIDQVHLQEVPGKHIDCTSNLEFDEV
jgi:hypothetical protein